VLVVILLSVAIAGFATAHMLVRSDDRQRIPVCMQTPGCPSPRFSTPTEIAAPRAVAHTSPVATRAHRTAARPPRKEQP
jgi:hypothetical protein